MKILIFATLFLLSMSAMAESLVLTRHFQCQASDRNFEIYFSESDAWNDPNTIEGVIAVNVRASLNSAEKRYVITNVDMLSSVNSEGEACLITIKYNTLNTEVRMLVNFCTKHHEMRVFSDNQEKVTKLVCIR